MAVFKGSLRKKKKKKMQIHSRITILTSSNRVPLLTRVFVRFVRINISTRNSITIMSPSDFRD